ncbi:MAG: hypothetical protein L3J82_07730 [Planctomycetes bacterium]|nr:hypothetical protein [Planctomycetota bacterium]
MLRSFLWLLVPLFILSCQLHADIVETSTDHSFEGVVTKYTSKVIHLNTGFGVLEFDRKSQVSDLTRSDYTWPSGSEEPSRSEKFDKWADEVELTKTKLKELHKKPNKDEGELDAVDFAKRVAVAKTIQENPKLSIKERSKKIKKLGNKFAYLSAIVSSVKENQDNLLQVTIEFGPWYDPRTGKKLELQHRTITFWARKGLNGDELDKRQDEDDGFLWIDYSAAEELKAGSELVVQLRHDLSEGSAVWVYRSTRFVPRKKAKVR